MEEILQKYRRYNRQIEMAWMDVINGVCCQMYQKEYYEILRMVLETLKLLKQLLHFIWKQYDVILLNFYNKKISEANSERNEKLKMIQDAQDKYEVANENLHKKLKAHFGHTNNKLILEFVFKEADKLKSKMQTQEVFDWLVRYEVGT